MDTFDEEYKTKYENAVSWGGRSQWCCFFMFV